MLGDQHKNTKMKDDVLYAAASEVQLSDKRHSWRLLWLLSIRIFMPCRDRPLSKLEEENLVVKILDYFRFSPYKSQIYFWGTKAPFFSKSIPLHLCCKQIELNTCDYYCVLRKANLRLKYYFQQAKAWVFSCDFQDRELFCNLIPPSVVRMEKWEVQIHFCYIEIHLTKL